MSFTVISAGPLSSIQDLGRMGYQESGFSPSGAADTDALKALNLLLNNDPGEAAVEMTLLGMTIRFDSECVFAVTGVDDSPVMNGVKLPMYQAVQAHAGDELSFGYAVDGVRTYFGIAGGFDIPVSMGSRSTGMKFSVGGYHGRKLAAGDVISFREIITELPNMALRKMDPPVISQQVTLRVVPGPQNEAFSEESLALFFSRTYQVSDNADRMGIRLNGPRIKAKEGSDIISDATANGAIQIINEGLPIILMQDRQTTGGYAKIACVISADLPLAGQLKPGAEIHFEPITVQKAQSVLRMKEVKYKRTYKKINRRRSIEKSI